MRAVLQRAEQEHLSNHNYSPDGHRINTLRPVGPKDWLAQDTGLNRRTIQHIMNDGQKYIGLSVADKILTGLELTHLLGREITVIPNPSWSLERWQRYMDERGCRR